METTASVVSVSNHKQAVNFWVEWKLFVEDLLVASFPRKSSASDFSKIFLQQQMLYNSCCGRNILLKSLALALRFDC